MTNAGFAFHRNGNITFTDARSGDTYILYSPRLGDMRQIEEYGTELAEAFGISAMRERLNEITEELAQASRAVEAAKESGDARAVEAAENARADLSSRVNEENQAVAQDLVAKTKEQSLKWFVRVVQLCGSDNWPKIVDKGTGEPMKDEQGLARVDVDELPAAVRNSQLVADIKSHWWQAPLSEAPSDNGAAQTKLTAIPGQRN